METYALTKSSNPVKVPVNSRSVFIITHIREPIHLSISSTYISVPSSKVNQ